MENKVGALFLAHVVNWKNRLWKNWLFTKGHRLQIDGALLFTHFCTGHSMWNLVSTTPCSAAVSSVIIFFVCLFIFRIQVLHCFFFGGGGGGLFVCLFVCHSSSNLSSLYLHTVVICAVTLHALLLWNTFESLADAAQNNWINYFC